MLYDAYVRDCCVACGVWYDVSRVTRGVFICFVVNDGSCAMCGV